MRPPQLHKGPSTFRSNSGMPHSRERPRQLDEGACASVSRRGSHVTRLSWQPTHRSCLQRHLAGGLRRWAVPRGGGTPGHRTMGGGRAQAETVSSRTASSTVSARRCWKVNHPTAATITAGKSPLVPLVPRPRPTVGGYCGQVVTHGSRSAPDTASITATCCGLPPDRARRMGEARCPARQLQVQSSVNRAGKVSSASRGSGSRSWDGRGSAVRTGHQPGPG